MNRYYGEGELYSFMFNLPFSNKVIAALEDLCHLYHGEIDTNFDSGYYEYYSEIVSTIATEGVMKMEDYFWMYSGINKEDLANFQHLYNTSLNTVSEFLISVDDLLDSNTPHTCNIHSIRLSIVPGLVNIVVEVPQ